MSAQISLTSEETFTYSRGTVKIVRLPKDITIKIGDRLTIDEEEWELRGIDFIEGGPHAGAVGALVRKP